MAYMDRYVKYWEQVPNLIRYAEEKHHTPVFGFTSNLDIVLNWDAERYNEILDRYLQEEPSAQEGDTIAAMEDFARISCSYIMRGLGGNFDITDVSVCEYLRSAFTSEPALGGTCAQGAAALGSLGIPVSIHITDDCRDVLAQMDHRGTTVIKDGRKVPVMEAVSGNDPVYHIIFQFNKGDRIRVHGEEITIPCSNRLILFYDTIHKLVPLREEFLQYWENTDETPSSILLSGFDAIIDEEIMAKRLDRIEKFLSVIRQKSPDTVIYFEGAFYMNSAVKDMIFRRLGKYADIIGMNEEELEAQLVRMGREHDITSFAGIIDGITAIMEEFSARGIILHTKDYSMYYGRKLEGIDIEAGLTRGNLMSGTRARIGRYGTYEECLATIKEAVPGARGLEIFLEAEEYRTRGRFEENGTELSVVPTRLLEHPRYTIGLGDTFVSGVHTCFIRREK